MATAAKRSCPQLDGFVGHGHRFNLRGATRSPRSILLVSYKIEPFSVETLGKGTKQAPLICAFFAWNLGEQVYFTNQKSISQIQTPVFNDFCSLQILQKLIKFTKESCTIAPSPFLPMKFWIRREKEAHKWRLLRFTIHHSSIFKS